MQQLSYSFERPLQPNRLIWCDALRLLAFFLLFCCHAADPFYASATYASGGEVANPEFVSWGTRWGSLVRPCVPLFVMLTGVLSLPVKTSMTQFYKRRIPRILFPFVIWSVIYYMTPWITGVLGLESDIVRKLFAWAESDSQAFSDGLTLVARIPYTFSFLACHMWYIYMLVGLYLYLPVFSAWVERATKKEKEIVLVLWLFSTMLPYFSTYVSHYCFGTCEWNAFGLFYYFSGFSGYMLLGHYIHEYVHWKLSRTLVVALPLLVIGAVITYIGYSYVMTLPSATPEMIELFWTYNSLNVVMMTVALFLVMCSVRINPKGRVANLLANLTTCGFGIYMIHYYFVYLGFCIGDWLHIPTPLRIPFSAVIILVCSWSIVAAARRILGKSFRYLFG